MSTQVRKLTLRRKVQVEPKPYEPVADKRNIVASWAGRPRLQSDRLHYEQRSVIIEEFAFGKIRHILPDMIDHLLRG